MMITYMYIAAGHLFVGGSCWRHVLGLEDCWGGGMLWWRIVREEDCWAGGFKDSGLETTYSACIAM